jgi:hypothetical protein
MTTPRHARFKSFSFCRGVISREDVKDLERLAEKVLGPRDLRSSERAARVHGTYKGGVAIERSFRAHGVKGARCYTTAYSYQNAPKIASVTAGSKRMGGDLDNLGLRREVNLVCWLLFLNTISH